MLLSSISQIIRSKFVRSDFCIVFYVIAGHKVPAQIRNFWWVGTGFPILGMQFRKYL